MKTSSIAFLMFVAFLSCGVGVLRADVVITFPGGPIIPGPTSTATFKQGSPDPFTGLTYTGMEDNWLHLNGPFSTENRNAGADGRIIIGGLVSGPNDERHSFIRFDLSSMVGQFDTIEAVTLRLFWHVTPTGADTVQFFPVSAANADWVEGNSLTGVDTFVPGESTWANKNHPGTPWAGSPGASTPGVDYVNTVLASNVYSGSEVVETAFDLVFNDPSIILSWMGGGPNAGIYGRTIGQDEQAIFRSSEFVGWEPELIIQYTTTTLLPPPPSVPEPSTIALLLTGGLGLIGYGWRRRRMHQAI